jgi:hypothetical protein
MKFKTKEGTQKVDFWGPPILVLTRGCHLESDEISRKEGAQKVGFLGLQNTGPSRRGPKEIQILRVLIAYKNISPCLGPYKMTFVRLHPCPQLATLPDTRNLTKMRMLKRFCFLFNVLL